MPYLSRSRLLLLNGEMAGDERAPAVDTEFPFVLPARGMGDSPVTRSFVLSSPPADEGWRIEVTAKLRNRPWQQTIPAYLSYPPLAASPLPESTIEQQLATHTFLQQDEAGDNLVVPAGTWQVNEALLVPRGMGLVVESGATL